ncbi:MAG: hypothetical protein ABI624_04980 [Casimicrobiaceae bacterium]
MIPRLRTYVWLVTLLFATTGTVRGEPISIGFSATAFSNIVNSDPAPVDPVSGTLVYEAASITTPIESILSISLTIAGYTYSASEIVFLSEFGIFNLGGSLDGLGSGNFENDFVMVWDDTLTPLYFQYSVIDQPGIWYTFSFPTFEVTSAVSEPSTLALLGLAGFLIVPGRIRRRRIILTASRPLPDRILSNAQ